MVYGETKEEKQLRAVQIWLRIEKGIVGMQKQKSPKYDLEGCGGTNDRNNNDKYN